MTPSFHRASGSDTLYQDSIFSSRAYCCMSSPYHRSSLDLDLEHPLHGTRFMSENDLRRCDCPCCGGNGRYVCEGELLFERDSDSLYLPSYQRYFRSYSHVQDQDDYLMCGKAMRYVTADDVLLNRNHNPMLSSFTAGEYVDCSENEVRVNEVKTDLPSSGNSCHGNTNSGSSSLSSSDRDGSNSACSNSSSKFDNSKSSHAKSCHSLSDRTLPNRPKPVNTKFGSAKPSGEVKKLPPFIPMGRRTKKGPKKYYPVAKEKPGNPDEIDPVSVGVSDHK